MYYIRTIYVQGVRIKRVRCLIIQFTTHLKTYINVLRIRIHCIPAKLLQWRSCATICIPSYYYHDNPITTFIFCRCNLNQYTSKRVDNIETICIIIISTSCEQSVVITLICIYYVYIVLHKRCLTKMIAIPPS